jgi:hypothetical protein
MKKLTPKLINALEWLAGGNQFAVCTSFGRCLGNTAVKGENPPSNLKTAIDQLFSHNLIITNKTVTYGLRWESCHISEKGLAMLKELSSSK